MAFFPPDKPFRGLRGPPLWVEIIAMDGFQPAQGQVGGDLRSRDGIGVAQEQVDGAQIGAMLHHMGGATVAQCMRAGGPIVAFHEEPDGLAGERHAAQMSRKKRKSSAGMGPRGDAGKVRMAFS